MMTPRSCIGRNRPRSAGFTMVELMVGLVLLGIVVVAIGFTLFRSTNSMRQTSSHTESEQSARAAIDLLSRDIRSSGYATDLDYASSPQPAVAYVDSMEIILSQNQSPYPDTLASRRLGPQAYNPAANPKPFPLTIPSYTPPIKYRTGAELIRYTLDVNNDGVVNSGDIASTQGADAASTPNPDDYVLVRQVYGDSTNNVAGDNGGSQERIALVRKPGGAVPPLFTVYMKGSSTPWNWANGPVPASQLQDIERVQLAVTATSAKPDAQKHYASTTLRTEATTLRSVPDWGINTYVVGGYVFNDKDQTGTQTSGDVGLSGVTVRCGKYVGYTSSTGYFSIRMPNGSYTLRHTPPSGYGVFTHPDSFVVTVSGMAVTHSFADTARHGGWVTVLAYNDDEADGNPYGDAPVSGVRMTMTPGGEQVYTNASGSATLFAPTGSYSVAATIPDSMSATTTNPVTGTMTHGGTASHAIGMRFTVNGHVTGTVYRDNDDDGVRDAGESGIQNVWVGVTKDAGVTVLGYAYTDAYGNYDVAAPANDPPHTRAYSVFCVPPPGFFPTSGTSIGGLWLQENQTLSNKNFGMGTYQVITLNASRVLSLAAGDLIEKDWNGNATQHARADADLILGADDGGSDNISVWFNQYATTPVFTTNATYTRLAPQSVIAIAADTLDKNVNINRVDLVTGTRKATTGNFFVWLTQGSSGNEGYLPSNYTGALNYTTNDLGDVQAVLTADLCGGSMPDILVGTKSLTPGRGTVELWQSNDATTPTFSPLERYPAVGSVPGGVMGEVRSMVLADLDNDGLKDLIVGTSTANYSGEVMVFKNMGKTASPRFVWRDQTTLSDDAVTSVAAYDVNQDGYRDILVGTQNSTSSGHVIYLRSRGSPYTLGFDVAKTDNAPGLVMSMSMVQSSPTSPVYDLVVGWRQSESSYAGGVAIYYLGVGHLPNNGVDPSDGAIMNMVPASTTANFNYGLNTTTPPSPYLTDIAVGLKSSATTGAIVVFIR